MFNQLCLYLSAMSQLAWRVVHNCMIMRHSVTLNNLSGVETPLEDDQKACLLWAPFTGSSLLEVSQLLPTSRCRGSKVHWNAVSNASSTQSLVSLHPALYVGRSFRRGSGFYSGK